MKTKQARERERVAKLDSNKNMSKNTKWNPQGLVGQSGPRSLSYAVILTVALFQGGKELKETTPSDTSGFTSRRRGICWGICIDYSRRSSWKQYGIKDFRWIWSWLVDTASSGIPHTLSTQSTQCVSDTLPSYVTSYVFFSKFPMILFYESTLIFPYFGFQTRYIEFSVE